MSSDWKLAGVMVLAIGSTIWGWHCGLGVGRSQGRAEQEAKDKADVPKEPQVSTFSDIKFHICERAVDFNGVEYGEPICHDILFPWTPQQSIDVGEITIDRRGFFGVPVPKSNGTAPTVGEGIYIDGKKAYIPPAPKPHKAAPKHKADKFAKCHGHLDPIGPSPQEGDDVDMDPVNCTIKVRVPKAEDQ